MAKSKGELIASYLIYVVRCMLNEQEVKPLDNQEISYQDVLKYASFHQLENIVFFGIEKYIEDQELLNKWKKKTRQNITASFTQVEEKEVLVEALSKNEIEFLPVKGFYLRDMYPRIDFRSMTDMDILINPKKAKKAKKMMVELGYQVEEFGRGNHDGYLKKPFVAIELHRSLLHRDDKNYHYYEKVFEKTPQLENNQYFHQMSNEDFYIYFLLHFYKHYQSGGSGIRTISDIYVFLKKNSLNLNSFYLEDELKKLGLLEFRNKMEVIAFTWFNKNAEEFDFDQDMKYIIASGVHGTTKHEIDNLVKANDGSKSKTLFKRIFPPFSRMRGIYPILEKAPILLPFMYIIRIFRGIFKKRSRLKQELNQYKDKE